MFHHVIARGIKRRSLFLTATDYQNFLAGCASRAWDRGRRLAGQVDLVEALKRQKGSYVPCLP